MKASIRRVLARLSPGARQVIDRVLTDVPRGVRVALVGGAVRDLVLRRTPVDLDLVVEAGRTPGHAWVSHEVARLLVKALGGSLTVHDAFGTAALTRVGREQLRVDVATTRTERYSSSGALPVVTPARLEQDLLRRDFSIHAMAIILGPHPLLCDPCHGERDLRLKRLTVLHPKSFEDDPTRLLRAVRYAARLGVAMDASTLRQFRNAVRGRVLARVSAGRIQEELIFMEKESAAFPIVQTLLRYGVLEQLPDSSQVRQFRHWIAVAQRAIRTLSVERISPSRIVSVLEALPVAVVRGLVYPPTPLVVRKRVTQYLTIWSCLTLKITGEDLKALGVPSGPSYRELLAAMRIAVLDGFVGASRSAQLRHLRVLIRKA